MSIEIPALAAFIDEINQILVAKAGLAPEDVVPDGSSTIEELGLDSLAAMELQAVLEARHGVVIPDDSVGRTVAELASVAVAEGQAA